MTPKVALTLQDLHALAAAAERNGTQHYFSAVALQWAAAAQAEIDRLRAAIVRADMQLGDDHIYAARRTLDEAMDDVKQ